VRCVRLAKNSQHKNFAKYQKKALLSFCNCWLRNRPILSYSRLDSVLSGTARWAVKNKPKLWKRKKKREELEPAAEYEPTRDINPAVYSLLLYQINYAGALKRSLSWLSQ